MSLTKHPVRMLLIGLTLTAVAMVPAIGSAQQVRQFRANLTGAGEVPPVNTQATGTFQASLDASAQTLTWTLTASGMPNVTAAHIHSGAAGVNGPIVLNLLVLPQGQTTNTVNMSGIARAADVTGPFANDMNALVAAMTASTAYANIHTTTNPGGEIRAQVALQAQATATATAAAATAAPRTAPMPAAPRTGTAGLSDTGTSPAAVALALALALVVLAGGRAATARRPR